MREHAKKTTVAVKQTATDVQTIAKNAARLIEAAALLVVASYAVYQTLPAKHTVTPENGVLLFAGFVIGLRGAYEFLRYLADKK